MAEREKRSRGNDDPDTLTLVTGVVALAVSAYLLVGGFGEAGVQWVLPLVVVGAGIVLLVTSAFKRRR